MSQKLLPEMPKNYSGELSQTGKDNEKPPYVPAMGSPWLLQQSN
jgi:hypothetical protein